jgi:leader peptidase (prepilin peptidase)/N-methyltransferase
LEEAIAGRRHAVIPVALGFLAGLVFGSFIAALTWRWPAGRSIAAGRSRCDHCDAVLGARDLVPVLSFVVLHGRCRQCGGVIESRNPGIELAAGAIGGLALLAAPDVTGVLGAVFGWALLTLAVLDAEHFWLPDRIVLPLGIAGLAAGLAGPPVLVDRLIGAAAGFAVLAAIAAVYRHRTGRTGLGGGDPKLLGAIGAWLGWTALPFVVLGAATLGLLLVAGDRLRGREVSRHSRVPLGALLAAAAWALWLAGRFGSFPW